MKRSYIVEIEHIGPKEPTPQVIGAGVAEALEAEGITFAQVHVDRLTPHGQVPAARRNERWAQRAERGGQ